MMMQTARIERVRRFTFNRPLEASFRGTAVTICDLSESGARIVHLEPLIPGLTGTLAVTVPSSRKSVSLKARVVWSRVLANGRMQSGLVVTDDRRDRTADLLDHLVRLRWTGDGQLRAATNKLQGTESDLRAAHHALDFLAKNRSSAARWKRLVERDTPASNQIPLEVMAAWELLGRTIDVELVAQAHREREPFVLDAEALLLEDAPDFEPVGS